MGRCGCPRRAHQGHQRAIGDADVQRPAPADDDEPGRRRIAARTRRSVHRGRIIRKVAAIARCFFHTNCRPTGPSTGWTSRCLKLLSGIWGIKDAAGEQFGSTIQLWDCLKPTFKIMLTQAHCPPRAAIIVIMCSKDRIWWDCAPLCARLVGIAVGMIGWRCHQQNCDPPC